MGKLLPFLGAGAIWLICFSHGAPAEGTYGAGLSPVWAKVLTIAMPILISIVQSVLQGGKFDAKSILAAVLSAIGVKIGDDKTDVVTSPPAPAPKPNPHPVLDWLERLILDRLRSKDEKGLGQALTMYQRALDEVPA